MADWNAKVESQEIPGVTGKFGLGVRNEAGQRLIEFGQENTLVIANTLFQNTREDSTHGHHLMANTEIRLFSYFTLHPFTVHLKKTLYHRRPCLPYCLPLGGLYHALLTHFQQL